MLGSLILYLKGMRTAMFQLSGFYCTLILIVAPRGPRYGATLKDSRPQTPNFPKTPISLKQGIFLKSY